VDCAALARRELDVLVLSWDELALNLLQPPTGMPLHAFVNVFVELLARHQSLFATRRLLTETLHLLFQRHTGAGYPLLSEWLTLLASISANAISRLGHYKETALFALKEIAYAFGSVLACRASDVLDRIVTRPGLTVVVTEGLSAAMASLLASLCLNWAYETRGRAGWRAPLYVVLDDALPLVREGVSGEAEGGSNPVSTWSFMGRSRGLGLLVSTQNYSAVSSALRSNTSTVVCCGSFGRDARELALDLHLTPEQAALLPRLQPGEVVVCCRPVWPSAVYGRVPLVR
jgi:hypothetical protein